jgi:hypothetical protein
MLYVFELIEWCLFIEPESRVSMRNGTRLKCVLTLQMTCIARHVIKRESSSAFRTRVGVSPRGVWRGDIPNQQRGT